ncbi:PE/PPE C-terminal domain-containing protein [Mycobacterium sp. THU-M104]|uniref:PE/PPE C-terminal domain-containing protein n=1 Tax=Mycobacterium sp. THU-M104 TaxID=3410515 RepID=UPI003BA0506E
MLNLMSGKVATPLTNAFNSSFISNEIFAGYVFYPGLFLNNIGDLTSLGTLFGRAIAPGLAVGLTASQTGGVTPTVGGLGTLVGQHALSTEVAAGVGKASLVGALSTPRGWTTAAPAAAIRLAAAESGSPMSTPVFGIGPMGLPGMPMSGAGRGGSPSAPHSAATPRYGFRLTVLPPEPTGNATV